MNDWLKVIVPVLLTAMMAIIFNLFNKVSHIQETQVQSRVWTYRIEQNEIEIKKLQNVSEHGR